MSNSILCHSLAIPGFDHISWDWSGKNIATETIRRKEGTFKCSACKSYNVTATRIGSRNVRSSKIGVRNWILAVEMHRIRCHDCEAYLMEELPFLSHYQSRITLELERTLLELRPDTSISALAKYFDLDWRTIKNVEKRKLSKKYKTIRLADVRIIGMDEIYVGIKAYKTIVRDLETGAVLYVGDGKGGDALKDFAKKLNFSKAKIVTIAMDMSSGYSAWANKALPDAEIVFDHFHVIKLMNDKVDKIRRRTVKTLEEEDLTALKKKVPAFEK